LTFNYSYLFIDYPLVVHFEFSKLLEFLNNTKFFILLNRFTKMNECPRCNLPQNGINKCQYCGYDLGKYNKKRTKILRRKLSDFIGGFKKEVHALRPKKSKVHPSKTEAKVFKRTEAGERRSRTDRRKQKYIKYYPERRSGLDRRK
jgi:hypothetical protein